MQSRRIQWYDAALERLWQGGWVYPCTCTRAQIAAAVLASVGAPQEGDAQYRYAGTCREKRAAPQDRALTTRQLAEQISHATGSKVCWRLRVPEELVCFDDAIAGPQRVNVWGEVGDFPLTRFDGTPAYQLACVVDDGAMGMDMVIRGGDLLSSTPRQLLLYQALGLRPPRFAHAPLVIGTDGKRLAKRHGESRIAQFREQGVSAEKVVGWVAWRSGQIAKLREMSARELVASFDLAKLPREAVVLGEEDLGWLKNT